jgi:hypothetical protein
LVVFSTMCTARRSPVALAASCSSWEACGDAEPEVGGADEEAPDEAELVEDPVEDDFEPHPAITVARSAAATTIARDTGRVRRGTSR